MTSIEELRKKLYDDAVTDISELASSWGTSEYLAERHMKRVAVDLDSLISAARSEGVAEGATVGVSAARRQLRAASASITKQEGTRSIGGIRHYLIPVRAFSVSIASVLAPTKESEK